MFSNVKSSSAYFSDQQDLKKEYPTSTPKGVENVMDSSQVNAKTGAQNTQSRKQTPSTISVLQQKFGVSKDISFIPAKNGKLFFESPNGHFYPMPSKNVESHQKKNISSLSFTAEGLKNLRDRYDEVHGATTFLHSLLRMDDFSQNLHDMVKNPDFYPYFKDEKFLVMPNLPYDSTGDRHRNPKAQHLKDHGITSCAWFIHPHLSSINDDTRALLHELSDESLSSKPFIEKLRTQSESSVVDYSKQNVRDDKTIGQLKQHGEYLASILDLNASHITLLKNLKEKAMHHLAKAYGVNKNDQVALYFHFPYDEDTITLHLHIRVNHGFHPFEKGKSLTLDQIVSDLSEGKTIDKIILQKQDENNGVFYKAISTYEKLYKNIEGVTINKPNPNIYRLESEKSDAKATYSRDDLFNLKKVSRLTY